MADLTFNTNSGQTIAREMLIVYLNTGTTASPVWSAVGKRVEDSSTEIDWDTETIRDILGSRPSTPATWTATTPPRCESGTWP